MSDRDALLATIHDRPEDDVARLVFADWLEEHDETELGQFIRNDVLAAALPANHPARLRYELVEKPKLERSQEVQAHLPRIPGGASWIGPPYFHRGFPQGIEINFSHAAATPNKIAYERTLANKLIARVGSWPIESLLTSPWKDRLKELELIGYQMPNTHIRRFLDTPFAALKSLSISFDAISILHMDALIRSSLFWGLESFAVSTIPAGRRICETLMRLRATNLKRLSLHRTRLPSEMLFNMLQSNAMPSLEHLMVGGDFPASGSLFVAVSGIVNGYRLRSFQATGSSIGMNGAAALASCQGLEDLEELGLSACVIHAVEMQLLAESMHFQNVYRLDVSRNPIGDDGARAIASSRHFPSLLVLDLQYAQIGDDGFKAIMNSPLADQLVLLYAANNPISVGTRLRLESRFRDRIVV